MTNQDEFRQRLRQKAAIDAQDELERAMRGEAPTSPLVSIMPVDRGTLDDKAAKNLRVMVFVSEHDGEPHVVTRLESAHLVCTCPAYRNIEARPRGCWAMVNFRTITGMQQP